MVGDALTPASRIDDGAVTILTVVGARPQFVKAAVVSRALRKCHREILVHTGQHYDHGLSELFFRELDLPPPTRWLGVGSGSHAEQTGKMLMKIETAIIEEKPDLVVVYGDTNSTLAGAMAAVKLSVPVAHIEAGCRSYDRTMPEEVNRVVTDHMSSLLFCPTKRSVTNLAKEGITTGVHDVGDVMYDLFLSLAQQSVSGVLEEQGLVPGKYLVATIHRAVNTDSRERLTAIVEALSNLEEEVIFPVHPRTRKAIAFLGCSPSGRLRLIDPLGYRDMLTLLRHARLILTDSGGIQKEAFFLGTPCLTLRENTEWGETVEAGWNRLIPIDRQQIETMVRSWRPNTDRPTGLFGDGQAGQKIAEILGSWRLG